MKLVLNCEALAEALSMKLDTVRAYASRYPEKLPPRLNIPFGKPMWAVADVQEWVQQHRPNYVPPKKADRPARPVSRLAPGARTRLRDLGLLGDEPAD